VAYKELGTLLDAPTQTRRVRGRNRLEINLADLKHFTRYQLTLRAFNQVGHGPSSTPLIVTTKQGGQSLYLCICTFRESNGGC